MPLQKQVRLEGHLYWLSCRESGAGQELIQDAMNDIAGVTIRSVGAGDQRTDAGIRIIFAIGSDIGFFGNAVQKIQVGRRASERDGCEFVAVVDIERKNIVDIDSFVRIDFNL